MDTPYYGDGSELDAFEDLSIDPITEASFLKQPKVIVLAPTTPQSDVDDLMAINDLPVSPVVEVLFLKAPSTSKTCYNTSNVLAPEKVQGLFNKAWCQESAAHGRANINRAKEALKVTPLMDNRTIDHSGETSTQEIDKMSLRVPADEEPKLPRAVLPLPRELRDEVYKHLLCQRYRVNLPFIGDAAIESGYCHNPAFETVFPAPPFVRSELVSERNTDTIAPWASIFKEPMGRKLVRRNLRRTEEERYNTIQRKRWMIASPKEHLSILRVSNATIAEAMPILYENSTFCFAFCEPRKDPLGDSTVSLMKNVIFHIDLERALKVSDDDTNVQASTLEFARRLICRFGGDINKRKLCIVRIDHSYDFRFLIEPAFVQAIATLVGFQTVALRFTHPYSHALENVPRLGLRNAYNNCCGHFRDLHRLHTTLESNLGPGKAEYERQQFYSLVFQPLSHGSGSPPPKFDVKDLADRPGLFDVERSVK